MVSLAEQYGTEGFRGASREMPPVLVTGPTDEPLSEEEAKAQCRIDGLVPDLDRYIRTARRKVERDTESALLTQTWKQYLDYFPAGPIELRRPPIQSVSSITYTDVNGTTQTLSASLYELDSTAKPGLILPSYGNSWPSTRVQLRAITVTFVCGYASVAALQADAIEAIHAIALMVASMYQNREMSKQETMSYDNLIEPLQWRKFL